VKKAETEDNGVGKRRKCGLKIGDQIWDSTIHKYNLFNRVEDEESSDFDHNPYIRRIFNWEGKYK
jgi:hypothetical protein